ncbi:MAG: PAS domain S-box protein, partial [Burkholderiaceae bacterium]
SQFALADNLRRQGRYAETLPIFEEIIGRYRRYPNKIGLWWSLNARSSILMTLGNIAAARRDVEQAYALAKEIGVPLYLTDSAKRVAEIAAAKDDHRHAYRLILEASDMAAKAAKDNAATRLLQLTRRYQTETKQREIDKLNLRNQQQAAELKHRSLEQRWLWTVLGGSVIMLVGTGFFLLRLKHSHRRLVALNTQVLQAKNKLQATLDTIPDLLFELGLDGRYYDYHSPRSDLLVAPSEDLLGKTVPEVMPADAAEICMSALREAHENGMSTGKQFELSLPNGAFWFELSVAGKPAVHGEEPRFIVLSRNITERKQMEAQALQREQEFRVLVENSPDLIFRYDKDCRRIYANPAVARLVGRRADALLNKLPSEAKILSADEAHKLMQMIRQVLETGRTAESEVECLDVDGQLHYFHNRYAPEFNAHGEVVGVISVARDMTERKQAAEALAASEREFRTLAESLPDNIVRYDQEGRVIYVNPVLEKTLGTIVSKMLGTTVRERFPNGEYDDYAQLLDAVLTSGEIGEIEKIVTPPYSNLHLVHSIRMIAECDENGEVIGVLAIGRDITERKLAEQALRESEEKYRTLIQKIQVAVVVHGADTQILTSNLVAQEILGLSEDQLYGKTATDPVWHFFHENGRAASPDEYPVNKVLASGKALKNYVLGMHRPGHEPDVWVLVNADPVFGKDGEITQVIATFIDITQRKQAEQLLWLMGFALNQVREAVYIIDQEDLRFLNVNAEACRALGYSREELLELTVFDIDPDAAPEEMANLQCEIDVTSMAVFERRHKTKDGRIFPVEINAQVFEYEGRPTSIALARDITERKAHIQDLQRWRDIFEHAEWGVVIGGSSDDGTLGLMNPAFARMHGYAVEELTGQRIAEVFAPEYRESFAEQIVLAHQKGHHAFESWHVRKDGSVFPVFIDMTTGFGPDGRILHRIINVQDITERKRAEHDIALMSQALSKVHEAAYLMDDNARFLYVNDESCRALGYTRDELLTMAVMDVGPGWTLEMVGNVWQRQRKEGTVQSFEATHRRKDGSLFPVEINASQFEYDGKTYGLALVRDITERKRIEAEIRALNADLEHRVLERTEELRQQTRYLRTLIDTLPMMAWLKDKESRFLVVNQTMALACTLSVDDLVGKSDLDCWPREYAESYRASDSEVMATGRLKTVEEPFVDARNNAIWIETVKAPVLDVDGSVLGTVGIARDISDRKAMELARESALAEAERLAQLRSEFMARMSHELRTP